MASARRSSWTWSAPRSASATARWPAGIRPTCSASPCGAWSSRTGVDPERVDDVSAATSPSRRAGLQRRPQRVVAAGLPWTVPGHERGPPVRSLAAGHALRRPGRDVRRVRPGHRLRGRVDEPGARWRPTPRGGAGPFSPRLPRRQIDGQLMAQFRGGADPGRREAASPARRWTPSRAESISGRRRHWDERPFQAGDGAGPDQGRRRSADRRRARRRRGHPTRRRRAAALAGLRPAQPSGNPIPAPDITAGNSSQMSDGAVGHADRRPGHGRARWACPSGPASCPFRGRRPRTPCSCCRRPTR